MTMPLAPPYPLEPGRDEMLAMLEQAAAAVVDFVEGLPRAPSLGPGLVDPPRSALLAPPADQPKDFAGLLDQWRQAAAHA
ncbi:MAG TPA: hypothetical protein VFR22_16095, partial [Nocardioidaceae bacterium]|nr:hypothetical protein [Nocardioidaceae bacterium]